MSLTTLLRKTVTFDSACGNKKETPLTLDAMPYADDAERYTAQDLKLKAASAVQAWAETDDIGDDETSADRLQSLFIGIIDINKDGEINDDEVDLLEILLNAAWDYLAAKGADDDDIDLLLNDWDAAAADRIMDVVNGSLPDGDEAALSDIDAFAFGYGDQESVFDAVYKTKIAVRGGKKMRIRKRVSGTVQLSSKQKVAVRKMLAKSHSAQAVRNRMRSLRIRKSSSL